jgi:hypothetical protein
MRWNDPSREKIFVFLIIAPIIIRIIIIVTSIFYLPSLDGSHNKINITSRKQQQQHQQ